MVNDYLVQLDNQKADFSVKQNKPTVIKEADIELDEDFIIVKLSNYRVYLNYCELFNTMS